MRSALLVDSQIGYSSFSRLKTDVKNGDLSTTQETPRLLDS